MIFQLNLTLYVKFPKFRTNIFNINIRVVGKGFNNYLKEFARCKFGTYDNYIIVDAQVLDNEHLICKSPSEEITLPESADQ